MPGDSPNFPQTNPQDQSQQYQKQFFPFKAFQFDDPNVTNPPTLTLVSPWVLAGTGTKLTTWITGMASALASSNPVLLSGQVGYETDTKYFKFGDGSTAYNSLSYQPQYGKVAPFPQSAAGVGQFKELLSGTNAALSLPSGGTWFWFGFYINASTGVVTVLSSYWGYAAGGTQIFGALAGNIDWAIVWQIQ